MSNPPKSFRVGSGRESVLVSPWTNGAGVLMWRFKSPITGKDVRRLKRTHARDEVLRQQRAIEEGVERFYFLAKSKKALISAIIDRCPDEDSLNAALDHVTKTAEETKALTITSLTVEFIARRVAEKGKKTVDLRSVELDLLSLGEFYPVEPITGLNTEDLIKWLDNRVGKAGPKRKNDCRANVGKLYRYAYKMGRIPHELTLQLDRVPVLDVPLPDEVRYASIPEALFLLRNVKVEYRLWLVLGLFAGLRPEEIIPEKNRKRKGLDRSDIDPDTKTIYIDRKAAGKVHTSRQVPFSPRLLSWLQWSGWENGQAGPIHTKTPARAEETLRLGLLMDEAFRRSEGWPKDFLRHTYASHRHPILGSLSELASELGNSEAIIRKHYNRPLPKSTGKEYFNLRPGDLDNEVIAEGEFKTK